LTIGTNLAIGGNAVVNSTLQFSSTNVYFDASTVNTINIVDQGSGTQYPIVVSAGPSTSGLKIVRGVVAVNGTYVSGEGFTVVQIGTGVYTVTFSNTFVDMPSGVVTALTGLGSGIVAHVTVINNTGMQVETFSVITNASTNSAFCFQVIGQRNS